jgi:hypothetical protein
VTNLKTISRDRIFIFVLLLLIPIDWFSPTGEIFREAGAKPANIFVALAGLLMIFIGKPLLPARTQVPVQRLLILLLALGFISYLIRSFYISEMPIAGKFPLVQLASQSAMLLLFMFNVQVLIYYFQNDSRRQLVLQILPFVATFHLAFYFAEYFGLFSSFLYDFGFLFRNENGFIERSSGLMSEPSYYGTFAILFAIPMVLAGGNKKIRNYMTAFLLILTAVISLAKTMIVVLIGQVAFLVLIKPAVSKVRNLYRLAFLAFIPVAYGLILNTSAINVEDNLSSNMRLGSNVLAMNVAADGYWLFGAGIGQFHFLFRPEYAPDFLFLSSEAVAQFDGEGASRFSSFNLPLRLAVETGVVGLLLFLAIFFMTIRAARGATDPATIVGICFVGGSVGFLMTQDTYCLPALFLGLALALTQPRPAAGSILK